MRFAAAATTTTMMVMLTGSLGIRHCCAFPRAVLTSNHRLGRGSFSVSIRQSSSHRRRQGRRSITSTSPSSLSISRSFCSSQIQMGGIATEYLTSRLQDPTLTEWPSRHQSSSQKILNVYDPASPTSSVLPLAEIPIPSDPEAASTEAIEKCYERLTTGGWRDETTASHRSQLLKSWSSLMGENLEDLATICTLESGKPLRESKAEVAYARSFLDYFAHEATRPTSAGGGFLVPTPFTYVSQSQSPPPDDENGNSGSSSNDNNNNGDKPRGHVMAVQQAVGVCGLICPWNFPLAMITRKVGPALAAGCTAVVKPSELTPLSAIAMYNLAVRAGIDSSVFQLVLADTDTTPGVGTAFCSHPHVKKISFTGSTRVGKLLLQQAAGTVKRTSMELGGNACFVVFDDADIDVAVNAAMASKFRNAGQTCVASDRFLIQRGVYDTFIEKMQTRIDQLKMGPGIDPETDVGPLITPDAVDNVERKVQDAISNGAKCVTRGGREGGLQKAQDLGPHFSPPTLLTDVPVDCSLWRDETFGPVVAARSFDTEAEALLIANDVPVGLASYFCTRELGRAFRFAHELEVGMVGVNEGIISNCVAPFGGVKESGCGREGSPLGISEYLETKYIFMST